MSLQLVNPSHSWHSGQITGEHNPLKQVSHPVQLLLHCPRKQDSQSLHCIGSHSPDSPHSKQVSQDSMHSASVPKIVVHA